MCTVSQGLTSITFQAFCMILDELFFFWNSFYRFGRKNHGDRYPFDGRGGTLAHAFFPPDGRVHFDEDETYTHETPSGTNLLWVTVHELGHALGLYHSNVYGAVMYPYYQGYKPNMTLHSDDIKGIQSLYGHRKSVYQCCFYIALSVGRLDVSIYFQSNFSVAHRVVALPASNHPLVYLIFFAASTTQITPQNRSTAINLTATYQISL